MRIQVSLSTSLLYHGSPCADLDLSVLPKGIIFLTAKYKVARSYALGKVHFTGKCVGRRQATVYYISCTPKKVFDLRTLLDREVYTKLRLDHPEEELPKLTSEGFIMRHTGLSSYGNVGGMQAHLKKLGYDGIVVDEGSQGISLGIFNPNVLKIQRAEEVT